MNFVSKFLFGCFCLTLLSLSSTVSGTNQLETNQLPANTVRLVIEKEGLDTFKIYNFNANGKKEPLTVGTFLRASAEVLMGKNLVDCKKGTPLKIFYEKTPEGTVVTNMVDAQGNKTRFLWKELMVALPGTLDCDGVKPKEEVIVPSDKYVSIFFEKDGSGNLQTYLTHPDGRKELLEFSNLLTANAELFDHCPVGTEKERALYLLFEKNSAVNANTRSTNKYPPEELQTVQLDAYGVKEEFNLDNLINAASQTLQLCERNKGKTLNTAPRTQSLAIKFEQTPGNHLEAYLVDSKGQRRELTLESLLSAAAAIAPCKFSAKTHYIDVVFEKDVNGKFKPYVVDAKGTKKDFNLLGNLMTTAHTLCSNEVKEQ